MRSELRREGAGSMGSPSGFDIWVQVTRRWCFENLLGGGAWSLRWKCFGVLDRDKSVPENSEFWLLIRAFCRLPFGFLYLESLHLHNGDLFGC